MRNPYEDIKDPYGPENDFFRKWTKDEVGRDCLVGLTFEESQELERLQLDWIADRSVPSWRNQSREQDEVDGNRLMELHTRHEQARMARLMDPADQAVRLAEFINRVRE